MMEVKKQTYRQGTLRTCARARVARIPTRMSRPEPSAASCARAGGNCAPTRRTGEPGTTGRVEAPRRRYRARSHSAVSAASTPRAWNSRATTAAAVRSVRRPIARASTIDVIRGRNPLIDAVWKVAGRAPEDSVQVLTSLAMLLLMRRILPPFIRLAFQATSSKEWRGKHPVDDPEALEITEQAIDWEHSRWKWALDEVFPTLRIALQIDVVGRLVAIVLANTGTDAHPLAVFLTDTIARPTLISIALLLGISRIVCDWMDTEKKKRQLKDLSIEDRNRIEGLVRVGTIFTVLGTFVAAMHIIGIDVRNIVAIGGFSGVAIGLAGRQLAESFLAGVVMFAGAPFEKGENISFKTGGMEVTGHVVDIGFLKTTVRSEKREVFTVPNAAFMSGVTLNKSRKLMERLMSTSMRVRPIGGSMEVGPVETAIRSIRARIAENPYIILELPMRVHLREITLEGFVVTIHCYIKASSEDKFLDRQQALLEEVTKILAENKVVYVWSEPDVM